uniref:WAP domain-containing protein n=1 Tax=Ailuropoda melanoleuca TaxID=9646 RepID=A0A7N5JN51_AILME
MKTGAVFVLVAFITVGMELACAWRPPFRERPRGCPEVPKEVLGFCAEMCSGDQSCPRGMKCCSNGCGHVCQYAVPPGEYESVKGCPRGWIAAQWTLLGQTDAHMSMAHRRLGNSKRNGLEANSRTPGCII